MKKDSNTRVFYDSIFMLKSKYAYSHIINLLVSPTPISDSCELGQQMELLTVLQWQLSVWKPCPYMFFRYFWHRWATIQVGLKYAMEGYI